jgi:hypothetical protein
MSRGPKAVPLDLTEAERAELRRLLRRRGVGQALAQRTRVLALLRGALLDLLATGDTDRVTRAVQEGLATL